MPKKNNSIGSAHVIIITAIVVVLVGAVGYLGWNAVQNKNNSSTTPTTSGTENDEPETPSENTNTPTETNVVKLEDWGVKFTLVESLASTQVKYEAETHDRQAPAYAFTTARVEALGGECVKEPFGDTAILIRFAEKPVAVPDGELINESPMDGYYYVATSPIAPCQPGSEIEAQDRAALKESVKTLEAIN